MAFFTKGLAANRMVLLQNEKNCVFGCAPSNCEVKMTFRGKDYCVKSDENGEWKIEFNAGSACVNEKMTLCCEGENQIVFDDVAVGEVWLCSGQSNMQLFMDRLKFTYPEEYELPENENIRMITVPVKYNFEGEQDKIENPQWNRTSPATIGPMSGTAYFFAKKLQKELGVPIGIINSSQGGTPICAWMNAKSFEGILDLEARMKQLKIPGYVESEIEKNAKNGNEWGENLRLSDEGVKNSWKKLNFDECADWGKAQIPGTFEEIEKSGVVWFKKEITLSAEQAEILNKEPSRLWLGTLRDSDTAYVNGVQVGGTGYTYPPRRYEIPCGVLHEGKNTLTFRVMQNGSWSKMHFFDEKPYCLFSRNVRVTPTVTRNVEKLQLENPHPFYKSLFWSETEGKGVFIPLTGEWIYKIGCQGENPPGGNFFEYEPEALYNAMLAPCFNTAVRGALWYQGESDSGNYAKYESLLTNMMKLWREKFTYCPQEKMPFVICQLPNWAPDNIPTSNPPFSDWALMREAQAFAVEKDENAALSVMIDAGEWNDLHPEKKLTGGTRAAEQALGLVYKKNYLAAAKMKEYSLKNNGFEVIFESALPLKAYKFEGDQVDFSCESKSVAGFAVITHSRECFNAEAELVSDKTVLVKIPGEIKAEDVSQIRYLWSNCPVCVNLYTENGLPVQPGRFIL